MTINEARRKLGLPVDPIPDFGRTTTRRYTLAPRLPGWRLAVLVGVLAALAGAKAAIGQ
jgi:hypothetical protein